MVEKKLQWSNIILQSKNSVIGIVYKNVIGCGTFGLIISVLFYYKIPVSQPILQNVIPSIVLGLLLVLRTNTAYDRFWEGRKAWGSIVNNVRNLARQILVSIPENNPEDRIEKIAILNFLVTFAVTTKFHLRGENINDGLLDLVTPYQAQKLKNINHAPLEVAFWIGDYLQQQHQRKQIDSYQLVAMQELLNNLVDNLGACERILRTPMPIAYSIHLRQLLLLYCLLLPFQLVQSLGWWTGLMTALISFTLFGIEAIGIQIEDPFGHDSNDLPLDNICKTMKRNIDDLISFNSGSYAKSYADEQISINKEPISVDVDVKGLL
jgi:ion channel-forming bestrophin family protein